MYDAVEQFQEIISIIFILMIGSAVNRSLLPSTV